MKRILTLPGRRRQAPDGDERPAFDEPEEVPEDPEVLRLRILQQAVSLAFFGLLVMVGAALVMAPQMLGSLIGIATVTATMGFVLGRRLYRQDEVLLPENVKKVNDSLDEITRRLQGELDEALKAKTSALRAVTRVESDLREMKKKNDREREARREAQRLHVEHMRDCHAREE